MFLKTLISIMSPDFDITSAFFLFNFVNFYQNQAVNAAVKFWVNTEVNEATTPWLTKLRILLPPLQ